MPPLPVYETSRQGLARSPPLEGLEDTTTRWVIHNTPGPDPEVPNLVWRPMSSALGERESEPDSELSEEFEGPWCPSIYPDGTESDQWGRCVINLCKANRNTIGATGMDPLRCQACAKEARFCTSNRIGGGVTSVASRIGRGTTAHSTEFSMRTVRHARCFGSTPRKHCSRQSQTMNSNHRRGPLRHRSLTRLDGQGSVIQNPTDRSNTLCNPSQAWREWCATRR